MDLICVALEQPTADLLVNGVIACATRYPQCWSVFTESVKRAIKLFGIDVDPPDMDMSVVEYMDELKKRVMDSIVDKRLTSSSIAESEARKTVARIVFTALWSTVNMIGHRCG